MEITEIQKECRDIVEQVSEKYGYDNSLKTVLLKAIFAMLKDCTQEERDLFYQMLSHTPIVIVENLTEEGYNQLLEQYIGKDINQHIIDEKADLGEYGKGVAVGAYVSEPIIDENMKLQGKKSFLYIQKVRGTAKDFYGTDINVAHLIHELGHAWHAEKEQYVMEEDGTLKERVGTADFIYSFSKTPDNRFVKKSIKTAGLMIEESMNTIEEENAMAYYMGLSLEEMQKKYKDPLVPSNYQGYMTDFVRYMLEKLGRADFENYRLYGDTESKDKINALMAETDYWINREADIVPFADSPRSYDKKRAIIDRIDSTRVKEFFKQYESIYFPDISEMTPIEKIDNVLFQKYSMNMVRYNMELDNYKDFLERFGYEGYSLINQAAALANSKKNQEVSSLVELPKNITISAAVKNALVQGTTTDQVNNANCIENLENTKEGKIKDN